VTLRANPPQSSGVAASQTGTWTVGSNSATGSAVPANAFYLAVQNTSGNLTGLSTVRGNAVAGTFYLGVANTMANAQSGATYDAMMNNTTGVVLATGTTTSSAGVTITTYNASKAVIVVNISAFTSGSLTVAINGISSSGYSYPILTSTALSATGVTPLRIFPSATPSANAVANDMVPRSLQVVTTVSGTLTYGIDYELSV
jgi:hypothetical protein